MDFAALVRDEKARALGESSIDRRSATPGGVERRPSARAVAADRCCAITEAARPEPARLVGGLETLAYVENFVSEAEEAALMAAARVGGDGPSPDDSGWVQCRGRRLRRLGGAAGEADFEPRGVPTAWAAALCAAVARAEPWTARTPNHVLVNAYDFEAAGGSFVLPHCDGPAYSPCTATLSCGADVVIAFAPRLATSEIGLRAAAPTTTLLLRRRSLLIFSHDAYVRHTHGIAATATDLVDETCVNCAAASCAPGDQLLRSGERLSFTIRHALAVRSEI